MEVIGALGDHLTPPSSPRGNQAGGGALGSSGVENNYPQFIIQNGVVHS